jgi:hypothetical protein
MCCATSRASAIVVKALSVANSGTLSSAPSSENGKLKPGGEGLEMVVGRGAGSGVEGMGLGRLKEPVYC